jgi:ABC-type sugar transport system ATPase subunit
MNQPPQAPQDNPVLSARNVGKRYGRLSALKGVSFDIFQNEVVGLVGDNGAGKSTLMKIISGALDPSEGSVVLDGQEVMHASPQEARDAGIETVYQDLALALDLTVADNLFLGREIVKPGIGRFFGWLDDKAMEDRAQDEIDHLHVTIRSVKALCNDLSGGQRQAVAVARAAAWGSRVVLMDEPTAALGVEQQKEVGELIVRLAQGETPVLLVSHNLPQVLEVTDRILVLRQGELVNELQTKDTTIEEVVLNITGGGFRPKNRSAGEA